MATTFASWPPPISFADQPPLDVSRQPGPKTASIGSDAPCISSETKMVGKAAVTLHQVDGELFIADPEGLSIHHLNAIGAGLWNLLSEPISQVQSIEVLCGAFPDADRSMITSDVAHLFTALSREGLIVPAE